VTFVPFELPDDCLELTTEQIEAMAATVAHVKDVVAEIVARECHRAEGLVARGRLTRAGLDAATDSLGIPRVSDEEWNELHDGHDGLD
jgi:hypothetical protein